MVKRRYLFSLATIGLLMTSCGNEINSTHKAQSANKNGSKVFSENGSYYKDLQNEPVVQVFEARRKILKSVSSADLAVVNGECDGKYMDIIKCVNHKMIPRWVKIPEGFGEEPQKINGSVLTEIKDSRICLDANKDNLCDSNEPLAITSDKSKFILKLTDAQKNSSENIIAVRGVNTQSNRNEISILQGKNVDGVVLSPFSTLIIQNPGKESVIKGIYPNMNDDTLKSYKDAILIQKSIDILVASYDLKEDKDIINKDIELYKMIADKFTTSLNDAVGSLDNSNVNKAKAAVKKMINQVNAINLTDDNKEALVVVLNDRLNDAKEHFRKDSSDLVLDDIKEKTLKQDAIRSRLEDIGVEGIDDAMIKAVNDSGLKLSDMEDLEKVREVIKNKPEFADKLKPLEKQLEKKANATSELLVLKALLVGDTLEIYFSENADLKLSDESKKYLSGNGKTQEEMQHIVKKVYTIEGLEYEVESISFNEKISKQVIKFKTTPTFKDGEKRLRINYLALKDNKGKYTKEKQIYSIIEALRGIPSTGQKLVWAKGDDASLGYGIDIKYKPSSSGDLVWTNEKTNLMWQDAPYTVGKNDVVTYADATNYCDNLSYAGFDDWRMPNVKELITTTSVNMQEKGLFKNYSKTEISFSDSSQSAALGDRAIGVDKYGQVTNLINNTNDPSMGEKEKYSVRCVRNLKSNKPSLFPDAAFDNIVMLTKDKTSYDPSTGIVYLDKPFTDEEIEARKKASEEGSKNAPSVGRYGTLEHGMEYCAKLNEEEGGKGFDGFKNWRMANANEVFYSLNSSGSRTFQHRLEGFDYTLTSTSSLKDGMRYPWIVGNFFNRKTINNRSKGFFRCVASMDKKPLHVAKEANAPKESNVKRKYSLGKLKDINITLPANIFDKYEGISLTALEPLKYLETRQYEISRIIPAEETYPGYSLVSVVVDGKNICTLGTEWQGISQRPNSYCVEQGLFRTNLDRELVLNSYGKSLLKEGKTYAITINKRQDLDNFTINLTIGTNRTPNNSSLVEKVDTEGFSVKVSEPKKTDIQVSVGSGYRLGGTDILSSVDTDENFKFIELYDDKGQPFTCKGKSGVEKDKCLKKKYNKLGGLVNFKIASGNKDIFEVLNGFTSYLKIKNENLSSLKVGQEYPLTLDVIDPQSNKKVGSVSVKVIITKPVLKTKDVSVDISDAVNFYGNKEQGTNNPILYTFQTLKPRDDAKSRLHPFDGKQSVRTEDVIFEMANDDTYELKRFDINYGEHYAIVLKSGKNPPASKTLSLTAKVPYKSVGQTGSDVSWVRSTFSVTITNTASSTYAELKAKCDGKALTPIGQIAMPTDKIVKEKMGVVLQDYTNDDSSFKLYPSSRQVVLGKHFIESDNGLTGVDFEVISGDGKEYFDKKLEFYIDGYVLKFNKNNLPKAGVYNLKIQAKKGDLTSNTATVTFTVVEIKAPSVVSSVDANLANDSTEPVSLTKDGAKDITSLFLLHTKSSSYESLELLDRDAPVNGQSSGNIQYNGCEVDEEIYELVSSTDSKYYIKRVYRGSLGEPIYGVFLKAKKTANAGDTLKVKVIGVSKGKKYPNSNLVIINIKGASVTNSSSEDYEKFVDPANSDTNPYDKNADPNFVLKESYIKTSDDPYKASAFESIWISTDSLLVKPSKSPTGKNYILQDIDFDFEVVGGDSDKFDLVPSMYKQESMAYSNLIIKAKDKNTLVGGDYSLHVKMKFKDASKSSNVCVIKFTLVD